MPSPILKLNKLFNVYNTTLRMLHDRGCTILGPQPVVEALAADPTSATPVSMALLKKMARPDAEDARLNNILINRAALTITCTLSTYVLQLTGTTETNAGKPLMQVAFVEEESVTLSMNSVSRLRDSARSAGAQWLVVVADAKIPGAVKKETDELNVGWGLLTTSAAGTTTEIPLAAAGKKSGGIVTDIVEKTVPGIDIPAGAKPRRATKKSAAAATEAAAAAVQNAFLDENQPITALIATSTAANDDENDNADEDGEKKDKKAQQKPRPLFVELFEEDDIVFSPLRHSLAPKHRVLSESEIETLLREKGATLPQLPRMEFIDPIARYFGLMRGAVVHIQRAAHTDVVGEHSMYRHIV